MRFPAQVDSPSAHPTRERIVEASADLMRRQGYAATGVKQIVATARAPFGSVYHFFPGGKEEIAAEAIRRSGATYALLIPAIFDDAPDVVTGVRSFFAGAAGHLEDTDFEDACPIATIALETSSVSEPLRQACADVFEQWIDLATQRFVSIGLGDDVTRELVMTMIMLLEGAFLLCRASRSISALSIASEYMAELVERAIEGEPPRS